MVRGSAVRVKAAPSAGSKTSLILVEAVLTAKHSSSSSGSDSSGSSGSSSGSSSSSSNRNGDGFAQEQMIQYQQQALNQAMAQDRANLYAQIKQVSDEVVRQGVINKARANITNFDLWAMRAKSAARKRVDDARMNPCGSGMGYQMGGMACFQMGGMPCMGMGAAMPVMGAAMPVMGAAMPVMGAAMAGAVPAMPAAAPVMGAAAAVQQPVAPPRVVMVGQQASMMGQQAAMVAPQAAMVSQPQAAVCAPAMPVVCSPMPMMAASMPMAGQIPCTDYFEARLQQEAVDIRVAVAKAFLEERMSALTNTAAGNPMAAAQMVGPLTAPVA